MNRPRRHLSKPEWNGMFCNEALEKVGDFIFEEIFSHCSAFVWIKVDCDEPVL